MSLSLGLVIQRGRPYSILVKIAILSGCILLSGHLIDNHAAGAAQFEALLDAMQYEAISAFSDRE